MTGGPARLDCAETPVAQTTQLQPWRRPALRNTFGSKCQMMRLTGSLNTLVRRFILASLLAGPGAVWGNDATAPSRSATETQASEPISLRLKRFEIPFSVDTVGTRPVEVQLFVSRDAGKQWVRFGSQKPDGKSFLFEATEDGAYWFATRTLDGSGNAHPQGPITPQLHVLVDATDPQIELSAELKDESIAQVAIRCFDSTLRPETLRVEYRTDLTSSWTGVPGLSQLVPSTSHDRMEGKLSFEPAGQWRQVSVRVIVKDGAGNQTIATHQLERARTASVQGQFASTPLQGQNQIAAYGNGATAAPAYNPAMSAPPAYGASNYGVQPYPVPSNPGQIYPGQTSPVPGYAGQPYAGQPYANAPLAGQALPGQAVSGQPSYPAGNHSANQPSNPYAVKAMELLNPPPRAAINAATMIPPSDVLPMFQGNSPSTGPALNAPNQIALPTQVNSTASGTPTVAPRLPLRVGHRLRSAKPCVRCRLKI